MKYNYVNLVALDTQGVCRLIDAGLITMDNVIDLNGTKLGAVDTYGDDNPYDYAVMPKKWVEEDYRDGLTWPTSTDEDTKKVIDVYRFSWVGTFKAFQKEANRYGNHLDDMFYGCFPECWELCPDDISGDFYDVLHWVEKDKPEIFARFKKVCDNLGIDFMHLLNEHGVYKLYSKSVPYHVRKEVESHTSGGWPREIEWLKDHKPEVYAELVNLCESHEIDLASVLKKRCSKTE